MARTRTNAYALAECLELLIPHDGSVESRAGIRRAAEFMNALQAAFSGKKR